MVEKQASSHMNFYSISKPNSSRDGATLKKSYFCVVALSDVTPDTNQSVSILVTDTQNECSNFLADYMIVRLIRYAQTADFSGGRS